jgi:hypothetical protein
MTIVNNLGAEIRVTPRVQKTADLQVTLTLTNESQNPIRLNAMYLTAPSLVLKFVDGNGNPVPTGPPPVPRADDGKTGRIDLLPGKPVTHVFEGKHIFGIELVPGDYSVWFRYTNDPPREGEWAGTIETDRSRFTVAPQ